MSQPSTERNSTMPLAAFFVGRWLPAEQPETLMQRFAFVRLLQLKLHWTPWNFLWFLLEQGKHHTSLVTPTTNVHRDLSTTFHVTTQHWEKQRHSVTSLVCRSLVACWTAGNSDAVVCFCQPSSIEFTLNAVKLPLLFVGARKTPHLIGDTHDPCTQRFEHHVPCHNPALRETAPFHYQPCLSVVGPLLNSRKLWCSGLLLSAFSVELALNAVKLPLVLCWSKQHNVRDAWAPCSMSRHNTVENSTLHWGPFFWFAKSCPSGLLCVENPQSKGQQGGNSPSSYVAQRSYGRCGGRVHGRMNLYLLSVWDPANPRTGMPFIMSCHAFSRVGNKVMLHTW